MTPSSTLYVCTTCRGSDVAAADQPRAGARLHSALQGADITVVGVECLSNCTRSCSAAIAAPGKWTYVIGNLDPDRDVADLLAFARQHGAHEHGLPVWRERPEHIRKNTIARVPPMGIKERHS